MRVHDFKWPKSKNLGSRRALIEIIDVTAVIEFFDEKILGNIFRFGALRLGIFFRQLTKKADGQA
jgi:hypothetical protein